PTNWMATAAIPACGRTCPAPAMLYASTSTAPEALAYRRRVQPDCGVSVDVGVWLRPNTFVHCSISSFSREYGTRVSAVPCHSCIGGLGPLYPGSAARTLSPH